MKYIDVRSDTVTHPTDEMRKLMLTTDIGDDVYDDDLTTKELEDRISNMFGKEAGLFVPSGTFGNQLALMSHCDRGSEVILEESSHIVKYEVGGAGYLAGVTLRTVKGNKGSMNPQDVEKLIRKDDLHYPKTSLICMENAHSCGSVVPLDNHKQIYDIAKKYNIPLHVDGARIFNACAFLNISTEDIGKYFDTMSICFSKGLCAPIGSVLIGDKNFINKAKKLRKMMGGGMRQVGLLAAPCIYSLDNIVPNLYKDHDKIKIIHNILKQCNEFTLYEDSMDINMIFFKVNKNHDTNEFINYMKDNNIIMNPASDNVYRIVTHYHISNKQAEKVANNIVDYFQKY